MNFSRLLWQRVALVLLVLSACTSRAPSVAPAAELRPWPWPISASVADSVHTEDLAPGVRLYRLIERSRPWRAVVLDVDLAQCVSVQSVKGAATAVGRQTTSALLQGLDPSRRAVGAVNADFFLFSPPGVPTGAHIERGRLIAGPGARPVFAMDSAGRPFIGILRARGSISVRGTEYPLTGWNRPSANALSIVDAAWGVPLDTAVLGEVRNFRDELRVINRPSDASGERAVGNAIAVLATCGGMRRAQRSPTTTR